MRVEAKCDVRLSKSCVQNPRGRDFIDPGSSYALPGSKGMYTSTKTCYNTSSGEQMAFTSVTRIKTPAEAALGLIQEHFPTYHPLVALAKLAHRDEVIQDPRLELDVHKAILPYVTPKLSSVEVKQEVTEDRRVIVSLFEDVALPDGRVVQSEIPLVTEVEELVPLDT